jgi:hypothetical protein
MSEIESLATVYFMKKQPCFESARKQLYNLGIKTSYDKDRVIFNTYHSHKNYLNNIYTQECNGLILEMNTWKPLCVPTRTLRYNIDTLKSNTFLHQGLYTIYEAEDGTCFNMYYFKPTNVDNQISVDNQSNQSNVDSNQNTGRWVISTASGYEMNNVKWENKTYQELITECLEKVNLSWVEFTNLLNPTYNYSFGFKHPEFHRFNEGRDDPLYKLWFIQSVDLVEESKTYLWANDNSCIQEIPNQTVYNNPVGSLKELYILASRSINDFKLANEKKYQDFESELNLLELYDKEHPEEVQKEYEEFKAKKRTTYEKKLIDRKNTEKKNNSNDVFQIISNDGRSDFLLDRSYMQREKIKKEYNYQKPCFGFILRSVNFELTNGHSDLFIESSLMRSIRKFWYENNTISFINENNWQNHKEIIIPLSSYLDMSIYQEFILLFPQYQDNYTLYNNIISKLVNYMIDINKNKLVNKPANKTKPKTNVLKQNQTNQTTQTTQTNQTSTLDELYKTTASFILNSFKNVIKINTDNKSEDQKRKMYFEFIIDPSMLGVLIPLFI